MQLRPRYLQRTGLLIGSQGANIKEMRRLSGAKALAPAVLHLLSFIWARTLDGWDRYVRISRNYIPAQTRLRRRDKRHLVGSKPKLEVRVSLLRFSPVGSTWIRCQAAR